MRRVFSRPVIFGLVLVAVTAYLWSLQPRNNLPSNYFYHYIPFSWPRRVERYDLQATAAEKACQAGTIERSNAPGLPSAIPRIVHFTWGLQGDGIVTFGLYLALRSALISLRPDGVEVWLHYRKLDRSNAYLQKLEPHLRLVPHADLHMENHHWHVAHVADILRLQILNTTGGIYLDSDVYALRPFGALLDGARDVVLAHEGGNRYGLCNAVILAKPGAPFLAHWLREYDWFDAQDWNYHSVVLPRRLANQYPQELCALSPIAFFWPLWTPAHVDYMHTPLLPAEARAVHDDLASNHGALFPGQLAYHAWSHNADQLYIAHLTPERILAEDTRFNILMRRFVEHDSVLDGPQ